MRKKTSVKLQKGPVNFRDLIIAQVFSAARQYLPLIMEEMKHTSNQLLDEIAELRLKIEAIENASSNCLKEIHEKQQNEELFFLLVENADEAILVIQNEKTLYANTKASEVTGYSRRELQAKSFFDLIHPDDRKLISLDAIQLFNREEPSEKFTCRINVKNGNVRWLETKLLSAAEMDPSTVLCFLNDITERKTTEEALRESEGKYRQLVEHAPAGMHEIDLTNGKFISVNDVSCEYSGYTREEFLNLNFMDVLTEESLLKNLERWRKIQNGEDVPAVEEYEFIGKNKRRLWVLVNTKIIYEGDSPVRARVITHDITNRKLLEQEISKAQKLESLGVLAGGIGHDFNNLLSGIMGNISLAKLEAERGENIMESLDEALRVSSKASALTQQLLVFSKGGAPVKRAAFIVEVLRDATAFTLRGSKVKCEFGIAEDLWPVKVDVGQFSQVIHNLVINALQAMSNRGKITLGAQNVNLETVTEIPLMPGRYIEITIQDQGSGIAPENLPKIFDPYFTTKSKGSGLGLTMSYTIIKRHDGHITVESEVGKGSVFRIFIPATEEIPEQRAISENRAVKGEGRILVMDDEEILRKVAKRMLHALGYEVACVQDGAEAIELYAKTRGSKEAFDAVIMDLTIPGGMGGKETIKKLLKIDPGAIVVVSSGYSNDPILSSYEKYGFRGVVTKPYRIEQLSWVMRDVLSAERQRILAQRNSL